ncbi:hypothetical protein NMY22_g7617 [Coprinellus aureogranulatus]|nr:hypothetical protein NMY22_g7617 [Coprinellus aureogranulatus]
MAYNSVPVNTSDLPFFFTRLPVRIHREKEEIQRVTLELVDATKDEGTKAHKQALYRHAVTGPDMNIYALSYCEADLDKLKVIIEFIELLWKVWIDIMEEVPLEEAVPKYEQLRRAMYEEYTSEPATENQFGTRVKRFHNICRELRAKDAAGWTELQAAIEEGLMVEAKVKEWESLEEYLDVRKVHSGNNVLTTFLRWSMGIHLTQGELEFIMPFTDLIGIWLGLMNDLMSWKRERTQPTDRVMNAVYVLMKRYNLPEEVAIDTTRGMLVKQEGKVLEMARNLQREEGLSQALKVYIESLEHYAGGWFYWCLLAPRYAKPQSFDSLTYIASTRQ